MYQYENYALSIAQTPNDNIELDLSTIDLAYLNAYQYLDGELVLDETKKAEEEKRAASLTGESFSFDGFLTDEEKMLLCE